MTKITIDDKEYDLEAMTEEQQEIIGVLQENRAAQGLLNHVLQCVGAVHDAKLGELKGTLEE